MFRVNDQVSFGFKHNTVPDDEGFVGTVCRFRIGDQQWFGRSYLHKRDRFNKAMGRVISLGRALRQAREALNIEKADARWLELQRDVMYVHESETNVW